MKYFIYIIFLFVFFSCEEYEFKRPLTPPRQSTIDTNLVGIWVFDKCKAFNDFNFQIDSHLLIIFPFNKNEYVIIFQSNKKKSNEFPVVFKGHISKIGSYSFANVKWISDINNTDYIYYAFKMQNDSLYYWGFLKNKVPYQINAKKYFSKHYNDTNIISAIRAYKRLKIQMPFIPNQE